jgi:hypothetical protein
MSLSKWTSASADGSSAGARAAPSPRSGARPSWTYTTVTKTATPPHVCGEMGQIEICEALLDRGSCIDARDHKGRTNLIYAIMTQSDHMCAMLIRRGADPNLSCMYSPLHFAIDCQRDPGVARLLVEHGANVHSVGFPHPVSHICADSSTGLRHMHIYTTDKHR